MKRKGFFDREEVEESVKKKTKQDDCSRCKLHENCKSPRMEVSGEGKKEILVIAEAPGASEDAEGKALVGQAGQLFRGVLTECGIDLDRDCWKTNAVCCRPPKNRTPSKREVKLCNPRLMKVVEEKKPKLILLLGGVALDSFLMNRFKGATGGINKWRGFIIPDQTSESWVAPTFHPSFILRSRGQKAIEKLFQKDIRDALKKVKEVVPKYEYEIEVLDEMRANNMLQQMLEYPPSLLAFDYETTGLKPYKKGHKVVCCGICYDDKAYVFEFTEKLIKWWKQVLHDRGIKKTAHNIKFEHQWSRRVFDVEVRRWEWDSMQATHIIDNRKGITGLKFQAYIHFGQQDYSSHLDKFLKEGGEEGFNDIEKAPKEELLHYCGMDSLLQYRLAKLQMEEVYL